MSLFKYCSCYLV